MSGEGCMQNDNWSTSAERVKNKCMREAAKINIFSLFIAPGSVERPPGGGCRQDTGIHEWRVEPEPLRAPFSTRWCLDGPRCKRVCQGCPWIGFFLFFAAPLCVGGGACWAFGSVAFAPPFAFLVGRGRVAGFPFLPPPFFLKLA